MVKGRLLTPVLFAAVLALLAGIYGARGQWTGNPASTLVTASVARGDVEEAVLASGTLKPARLVAVGAQASGRITRVAVALGQKVKAGDLLAEIDSVLQDNALRTARAALDNVRAQLAEKEALLHRDELILQRRASMVTSKIVSQADFEAAEADVKATQAQIEQLKAQIIEAQVAVENAQSNLGYTRITAPIDGTVLAIVSQQGQTVNATQSAPTIMVLGQLDTMTVRAEISEADVVRTAPGQPAYFTIIGEGNRRYKTELAFIEPAPESIKSDDSFSSGTSTSTSSSSSSSSSAVYYNGILNVPNPEGRLRTYMTAEVHIVVGTARDALTVPAMALGARGADGRYEVRVLGSDGHVETRSVEIGLNDKTVAEVRAGLSEGERVVTGDTASVAPSASSMPGPPPMGL
ncbi:efflux RND transporter periplasmic adaptor subunit [Ancylobacter dichloromethanicus]|uniref:Hemolysin secretion protein D n=1 Tax=Ancylobacter dichloromethanicus TaxID=518825 RepID=A0A9W6N1E2_9HYPH|nr:efflux RND transporter periplasmic adaptor subunit [Ancylobacter dichloromethanicus]MBS7552376.1 efflux RND transporter periplasmic adaptor subunit [Ancylobacter dichloromethanicus]GLK74113.1 hemolysin secretion protein D [Ancylobacter dichloromethanicus]